MAQKHYLAWAALGGVLILAGLGCSPPSAPETPSSEEPPATAEETPPTATAPGGNSITVRNQPVQGGAVVIERVVVDQDGWLAVHQVVNSKPNFIIGSAPLKQGENKNVRVSIRLDRLTPTLLAMLHKDRNKIGTFEFSAIDPPLLDGDMPVMQSFAATNYTSLKNPATGSGASPASSPESSSGSAPPTTANTVLPASPLAPAGAVPAAAAPPVVRTVAITAKQWEFSPATITVYKDEMVKLQVTSVDVTHGFYLPAYGVALTLEPGKTATAEFKAIQQGTFRFSCNFFCGEGHANMTGTLIVK